MDDIVNLTAVPKIGQARVNDLIVADLEALLADAKEGKIAAIGICVLSRRNTYKFFWHASGSQSMTLQGVMNQMAFEFAAHHSRDDEDVSDDLSE